MSASVLGITRSISACKRCRKKKIKCSHDFPKCKGCEKAGAECVSLDPATGREIPRSYIVHLESRVAELEEYVKSIKSETASQGKLDTVNVKNSSSFPNTKINVNLSTSQKSPESVSCGSPIFPLSNRSDSKTPDTINDSIMNSLNSYKSSNKNDESSKPVTFSGNGISFSKLMFAAVHFNDSAKERRRSSATNSNNIPNIKRPIDPTTKLLSSFSKNVALLPPKQQALDFIALYFAQSNSQLPIFHREEFFRKYFVPIYGDVPESSTFASTYTSIDWKSLPKIKEEDTWYYQYTRLLDAETGVNPEMDPFEFSAKVAVPTKFKTALYFINIVLAIASSTWHLQFPGEISENFKNAALQHIEYPYSSLNRLEALQTMLCLTLYSLMRPCVPGCWYLLGSSMSLCVDLGLHNESSVTSAEPYIIDMRRRLFWCCYSLDRQICVYLGRPFNIPEESIKVQFPSLLDDKYINKASTLESLYRTGNKSASYKTVALTMFKIRQLQAEVQSILYDCREIPRKFSSLTDWLTDISYRLDNWRLNAPKTSRSMNCEFTTEFFDLNYYHARIMLHGLSPARYVLNDRDLIDAAGAAKGILNTYNKLFNKGAINYTWAVTQNVFMAQMSFLYSLFNSAIVRNSIPLKEIQKYSMYANVVLKSLIDKCNAAEQCLEVLTILGQAVIKLKYPAHGGETRSNTSSVKSPQLNNIPSEDDVKKLQPGGHINANMRRLIVSIPELINSEEDKSREEMCGDRKRIKLDTHSEADKDQSVSTAGVESPDSRSKSQTLEGHIDASEAMWSIQAFDLDKFFEQVRNAATPECSRSCSHVSGELDQNYDKFGTDDTIKHDNDYGEYGSAHSYSTSSNSPLVLMEASQFSPNAKGMLVSGSHTQSDNNLHFGTKYKSIMNPLVQQPPPPPPPAPEKQLQNYQQYHSSHMFPYQRQNPNHEFFQEQKVGTSQSTLHKNTFQDHSYNEAQSISPQTLNQFNDIRPYPQCSHPMGLPNSENIALNNNNTGDLNSRRKENREGQRVFKLMFETGTESIWDQFFAQPFKLDDM